MRGISLRRAAATSVLAGLAITVGVAGPASAQVSYVVKGHDLAVASDGQGDDITVRCLAGTLQVNNANQLPCADAEAVHVDLGDGYDAVHLAGLEAAQLPHVASIDINTLDNLGVDSVEGSQLADVVSADPFDSVHGNGGDDAVEGAGDVWGGDGDDYIERAYGAVDAGPGNDTIVNPDGGAVEGGTGTDTFVGDFVGLPASLIQTFTIDDAGYRNTFADQPHWVWTGAVIGVEVYDLTFYDSVDQLDVSHYAGTTRVRLGGNDDTANVRNGHADTVDCGSGNDTVTADRSDTLAGCEQVSLPALQTSVTGPARVHKGKRAVYRISSDVAGATYQCRIDHKPFRPCSERYVLRTRRLSLGRHHLQVVASVSGLADPTPATRTIRVTHRKGGR